jgi:Arc/MetJ-type ribon-helix-helix transcriptional regulator
MSYQFPPDLDQRVKAQMITFGMPSEDDVLRAAMDALEQFEQDKLRRWQTGNELALQQSREGLSESLDLDALLIRVEERIVQQFKGK